MKKMMILWAFSLMTVTACSSATSTCHTSSRSSGSRSGILRTDPLRRQTLAVLAGREGEVFLEHASEVLGVFEAGEGGSLGDGVA